MTGRIFGVIFGVCAALIVLAVPASAQYSGPGGVVTEGDATCPAGGELNITADGFLAGSDVSFFFDGELVGTATADGDGVAVLSTTFPSGVGDGIHEIRVEGTDDSGVPTTLTADVQCTPEGVDGGTPPPVSGGGTLPRTGSDALPWVRVGVVLVAVGGLTVLAARKRHDSVRETV